MNFIKLNASDALQLESDGRITIIDASPSSLPQIDHQRGKVWKDNFQILCKTARHLPVTKVINFFKPQYSICMRSLSTNDDTTEYTWRYLYGLQTNDTTNNLPSDTEYVYILTNEQYTDLVKIGMTTDNVPTRVNSINNAGTVHEWKPVFALCVQKGTARQIEQAVHQHFDDVRVSSDKGSKREFFRIHVFEAIDKVREVGQVFQVGQPIIF